MKTRLASRAYRMLRSRKNNVIPYHTVSARARVGRWAVWRPTVQADDFRPRARGPMAPGPDPGQRGGFPPACAWADVIGTVGAHEIFLSARVRVGRWRPLRRLAQWFLRDLLLKVVRRPARSGRSGPLALATVGRSTAAGPRHRTAQWRRTMPSYPIAPLYQDLILLPADARVLVRPRKPPASGQDAASGATICGAELDGPCALI